MKMPKPRRIVIVLAAVLGMTFLIYRLFENNLPVSFFSSLLGVDDFKVENICQDDQITDAENGVRNEVFHISNENFASFLKNNLNDIPKPNPRASNFNTILTWRPTPIQSTDTLIIDPNCLPWALNKCFKKADLEKMLRGKGNYYAACYDKVDWTKQSGNTFQWYVIDSKNQNLYVIICQ